MSAPAWKTTHRPSADALRTTAAQAGGAADMWTLMGVYAPSVPEIVLAVGIFALGICAFTVLCQKLLKK